MLTLGLDIGTTTVSAVVADRDFTVLESVTVEHDGFLQGTPSWERSQDAARLVEKAVELTRKFCEKYTVGAIGITGQQHGIVYLDGAGQILSPLYTWQDGRGNLPYEDSTYAGWLSEKTGYTMASGYGLVTHFYNVKNGLVPENAAVITTIHDLVAMTLTGLTRPVTEPSDAQSMGFFSLEQDDFDREAVKNCGMDPGILPKVCRQTVVGHTPEGIPVAVAIGDNPASFLGATGGDLEALLLNVGTGSQISVWTPAAVSAPPLETRPFPQGGFLLVGAALCGGRAWAMTERFFSDAVFALTGQRIRAYEGLSKLLENTPDDGTAPRFDTSFDGTRAEPEKRASVTGLTKDNFTPGHLALGVLHGMTDELYDQYAAYLAKGGTAAKRIIGSGNGLRKNAQLRRITERTFAAPLTMSDQPEEAALGAAIFAANVIKR